MNELDRKIREALAAEESALFDRYGEQSLAEQVIESFQGRNRWLIVLTVGMTLVFVLLTAFFLVRFFQADDLRAALGWAVGIGWGVMAIAMSKIFYWMELNRLAVLREVKRLELQLAQLRQARGT